MQYILFSLSRSPLYPGIYVLSLGRGLFSSVTSKKDFHSFLTVWVLFFPQEADNGWMGSSNWKHSPDDCIANRMSWASCGTGKAAGRVAASLVRSAQCLQHPNAGGWHLATHRCEFPGWMAALVLLWSPRYSRSWAAKAIVFFHYLVPPLNLTWKTKQTI